MDLGSLFGKVVIAIAIAIGIGIAMSRQRATNKQLAPSIEAELRQRGPTTLPELATALGLGGFFRRGKVVMALNDLIMQGQVEMIDAPPGTPQLQKVDHIRYRWKG